jgi:hypothetical protein
LPQCDKAHGSNIARNGADQPGGVRLRLFYGAGLKQYASGQYALLVSQRTAPAIFRSR